MPRAGLACDSASRSRSSPTGRDRVTTGPSGGVKVNTPAVTSAEVNLERVMVLPSNLGMEQYHGEYQRWYDTYEF